MGVYDPFLYNYRFVPHYARVVSIANHFGNAYYHFVIESLIRLEPLLPEVHKHTPPFDDRKGK